jgi:photosystem II stability/assembly factor-like uncharacterized protein
VDNGCHFHNKQGTHMNRFSAWRLPSVAVCSILLQLLGGCATSATAVSDDTALQAQEGLLTLRVIDVGEVPIKRLTVVSEQTGEVHPLRAIRFGQTSTMTYVGRLPAGRYHPQDLIGVKMVGLSTQSVVVPLADLTGKFDVAANRVTDLGTMVFMEIDGQAHDEKIVGKDRHWRTSFALPLDPTPVPTQALINARFPKLAAAITDKTALGWLSGTLPKQASGLMDQARLRAKAVTKPMFTSGGDIMATGPLGVVGTHAPGTSARLVWANTVHAIESVLVLQDGRWLAGGEEGYLAVSGNAGSSWQRLTGLSPAEAVIHLSQAPDGRVFMVTDLDREAVVYESPASSLAWKAIAHLPSDREQGFMTQEFGEAPKFLPDFVAATSERLVIFTRPATLHTLDLRSTAWTHHETPRTFQQGMKLTPDGFVLGSFGPGWIYGSADWGASWTKLEAWVNMSQAHFTDRRHGVMVAADFGLNMQLYRLRSTEDGGKTWKTGDEVQGYWPWMQPLWTDPSGATLVTTSGGHFLRSRDQGKSWQ